MSTDFSLFGGAESLPPVPAAATEQQLKPTSSRYRTVVHSKTLPEPKRARLDPTDFLWLMSEEPHRSRRAAILKSHPEVTKLMGHEPLTKYIVLFVVTLQVVAAYLLRNTSPKSFWFVLVAYVVGGTANHNLFLAIHEITHNLAFKGIDPNKYLSMFANLPIGIPYAQTFKRYHIEHHKQLGEDGVDTDLPTRLELAILQSVAGKAFFCTFQILFYALRPGLVRSQAFTRWHAQNIFLQLAFDYAIVKFVGGRALAYFIMSSFFAGSLHPCAGHFIAEHYLWDGLEQETYSYYGPLNILTYNVGYHNEHHDFPSVPWTRLPALRAIAPEYYDTLSSHLSWPMVIFHFIFDDAAGLHARAKRLAKGSLASFANRLPSDLKAGASSASLHGSETSVYSRGVSGTETDNLSSEEESDRSVDELDVRRSKTS
ncbi:hypothetical protein FRB97_001442 [Tulasnella sp. 331]|nr:hypothetical protein FRB97_001442 [Tulasnella sp. 331]KAG8890976.1 hypothetical protein FRB98_002996 [Tulasnella sp. 332]